MLLCWLFVTLISASLVLYFIINPLSYWNKRNITSINAWFSYKILLDTLLRKISFTQYFVKLYNAIPNARYVGLITFNGPQLLVRDANLIKQITVSDFDNFINRERLVEDESDPFFAVNLALLENEKWRDMRETLNLTFMTSKMQFLYTLMNECAQNFTKYFEKNEDESECLEMKDVFSRFAIDVIATSWFGISLNSLEDKENEFYTHSKKIVNPKKLKMIVFFLGVMLPFTRKIFRIPFIDKDVEDFFRNVVNETINARKKNNVIRPDMIHLLLQTQIHSGDDTQGSHKVALTNEDITAQGILFFLGGVETISTALSFLCYELALNKHVQKRLRIEIEEAWIDSEDGQISYDVLMNLKYLDMVVSESLRKWPPTIATDRSCKDDYLITAISEDERSIILPKGAHVYIPIFPIHRDPNYFRNPEVFDPERFSEENKVNIVPGSYMPFGAGPRSCLASKFATMEIKVLILNLLRKFKIEKTINTPIPVILDTANINPVVKGGMWLKFSKTST